MPYDNAIELIAFLNRGTACWTSVELVWCIFTWVTLKFVIAVPSVIIHYRVVLIVVKNTLGLLAVSCMWNCSDWFYVNVLIHLLMSFSACLPFRVTVELSQFHALCVASSWTQYTDFVVSCRLSRWVIIFVSWNSVVDSSHICRVRMRITRHINIVRYVLSHVVTDVCFACASFG